MKIKAHYYTNEGLFIIQCNKVLLVFCFDSFQTRRSELDNCFVPFFGRTEIKKELFWDFLTFKDGLLKYLEKRGELKEQRPEPQVFTMNDIKHKMLVWNIKWLEEQQNQQVFFLILNLKFLRSFCCTYKQNRELSADT